jgi:hypothetical protein
MMRAFEKCILIQQSDHRVTTSVGKNSPPHMSVMMKEMMNQEAEAEFHREMNAKRPMHERKPIAERGKDDPNLSSAKQARNRSHFIEFLMLFVGVGASRHWVMTPQFLRPPIRTHCQNEPRSRLRCSSLQNRPASLSLHRNE